MAWFPSVAELFGFIGVALIVYAYILISTEKLTARDAKFHLLNLSGAIGIIISLMENWNTPSFVIEVIWISISLYGLWRIFLRKAL